MRLVDTTIGHLVEFRKHVRLIDLEEVEKASGKPFDDHLVAILGDCLTLLDDSDQVLGIGGFGGSDHHVWLITTTAVEERKMAFLRFSKAYLSSMLNKCGYLTNIAYVNNTLHMRWLSWLGAEWYETNGEFQRFILRKE